MARISSWCALALVASGALAQEATTISAGGAALDESAETPRALELDREVMREIMPDVPDDFDPATPDTSHCPACAAPVTEGAIECPGCGLALL